MHDSSFKNRNFDWLHAKDSIKLHNTINTCLIRLNFILFCSFSLNNGDFLMCHICQENCKRLKNHTHSH